MMPLGPKSGESAITQECKDAYKKCNTRKLAAVIYKYNDDGSELAVEKTYEKNTAFDVIKEDVPKLECR